MSIFFLVPTQKLILQRARIAATYVTMTEFAPRVFPDRAAEIKYGLEYGLKYMEVEWFWMSLGSIIIRLSSV
jgi:hypothetical protein